MFCTDSACDDEKIIEMLRGVRLLSFASAAN